MTARRSSRRSGRSLAARARALAPWLLVAAVALAAAAWLVWREPRAEKRPIEERLVELAGARGVRGDALAKDDPIRKVDGVFERTWRFTFPNREARDGFIGDLQLEGAARGAPLVVPADLAPAEVGVRVDLGPEVFVLRLRVAERRAATATPTPVPVVEPTATPRPQPAPGARGSLAILLDDAGQKLDLVAAVIALPDEVGVAVLPFLPKSTETASALHKAGHEVWLHLPMEPENYPANDPGPGAILVSMDTASLRTAVHSAATSVPFAVGVNNHMGSRATADLKTMTWVMQELSARDLAFIDSRTTTKTTAELAARAQGVPFGRRHVFLDNERSPAAIRRQLDEAVYRCRVEGEIIAIGHVDEVTVRVLAAELPGVAARGADLVRPSTLVR
ncbi:MAG: divergent polysaccharide deacetylase family protein [Thermoanaerobaculales bacterium]|nr:divergent polysaccharide deacetylase family protein [Thermoanaerobaculales bacterium]